MQAGDGVASTLRNEKEDIPQGNRHKNGDAVFPQGFGSEGNEREDRCENYGFHTIAPLLLPTGKQRGEEEAEQSHAEKDCETDGQESEGVRVLLHHGGGEKVAPNGIDQVIKPHAFGDHFGCHWSFSSFFFFREKRAISSISSSGI